MQVRNTLLVILKVLGKLFLGLIILCFILVATIHLPSVQKRITYRASNYLSKKISSKVEIQKISFSIFGKAAIEDLKIWDSDQQMIFSSGKIELSTNILDLLSGDFLFNRIHISNVHCHLTRDDKGLNIQFIIDAFQPKEDKVGTSNEVVVRFNTILLENVKFEFSSIPNRTKVEVDLEKFTTLESMYSSKTNMIAADSVFLQQAVVSVSSDLLPDTVKSIVHSDISASSQSESGRGLVYQIRGIEILNSDFSFNNGTEKNNSKFDPDHIKVQHIDGKLRDILITNDTLAVALQALSAQLPGFGLSDARARVYMNRNLLSVSELHLASGNNLLHADMKGWYDTLAGREIDDVNFILLANSSINPTDLEYFISDSILNYFKHWEIAELNFDGKYIHGGGEIKNLNLKTTNSQLRASGIVNDALNYEALNWKEMLITATVGSDFKRSLSHFSQDINVPKDLKLRLNSFGTTQKIFVDSDIFSSKGNLKAQGWMMVYPKSTELDLTLSGDKIDLGEWLEVSWLGPVSLTSSVNGNIGRDQNIEINGFIEDFEILDQRIHAITFQSRTLKDSATLNVSIGDLKYCAEVNSAISFGGPLRVQSDIRLDGFMPGNLLGSDTALSIYGDLNAIVIQDKSSLEVYVDGDSILFRRNEMKYLLDSMSLHAMVSPEGSSISYYSDEENVDLVSNFDLRDSPKVFQTWSENFLKVNNQNIHTSGDRSVNFSIGMENASMFQLLGM
ncbi:MAG: hypothetical protein KA444_10065, partial [Bacteroidia bacterium]|nr:hypothetical protein [Bacteroidia bacterium]